MSNEHASHCGEPEHRSFAHLRARPQPKEHGNRAERREFARQQARREKAARKDGAA